jgi:hypothetical protein
MRLNNILGLALLMAAIACNDSKETFDVPALSDYYPLQVGKYYIYRLDSTKVKPFNTGLDTFRYQIKDSVQAEFFDAANRKSYRIYRYIRDVNGTQAWRNYGTYYATPTPDGIETNLDNQRIIRLKYPILDSVRWKGGAYLSSANFYQSSFYIDWIYRYKDLRQPKTYAGKNYPNTLTVVQFDSTFPPNTPFRRYFFSTYSKGYDVYAKGIGLVYRDVLDYEYQPRIAVTGSDTTLIGFEYNGYGLRYTLIANN